MQRSLAAHVARWRYAYTLLHALVPRCELAPAVGLARRRRQVLAARFTQKAMCAADSRCMWDTSFGLCQSSCPRLVSKGECSSQPQRVHVVRERLDVLGLCKTRVTTQATCDSEPSTPIDTFTEASIGVGHHLPCAASPAVLLAPACVSERCSTVGAEETYSATPTRI
eukprot:PhM_4_TR10893/c1_g1_i1/m.19546